MSSERLQPQPVLVATCFHDLGLFPNRNAGVAFACEYALQYKIDVYVRNPVSDRVIATVRHKHLVKHARNSLCTAACAPLHA